MQVGPKADRGTVCSIHEWRLADHAREVHGGTGAVSSASQSPPGSFGSPLQDGSDGLTAVFGEVFETLDDLQSHPA